MRAALVLTIVLAGCSRSPRVLDEWCLNLTTWRWKPQAYCEPRARREMLQ
jgi:hypothetical protein